MRRKTEEEEQGCTILTSLNISPGGMDRKYREAPCLGQAVPRAQAVTIWLCREPSRKCEVFQVNMRSKTMFSEHGRDAVACCGWADSSHLLSSSGSEACKRNPGTLTCPEGSRKETTNELEILPSNGSGVKADSLS